MPLKPIAYLGKIVLFFSGFLYIIMLLCVPYLPNMAIEIKTIRKYMYGYESSMIWKHTKRDEVSKYVVINNSDTPKRTMDIVSVNGG